MNLEPFLRSATEAERAFRTEAAASLTSFCDQPYSMSEWHLNLERTESAMWEAAKAGDLTAQLWLRKYFGEGMEDSAVLDFVDSDEPWLAEMALQGLVGQPTDPRLKAIDVEVFSRWQGAMAPSEVEKIKLAAARWQACSKGMPCGAGGYFQHHGCLYGDYCDPNVSVQEYIRRSLSGSQYNAMLLYLQRLRELKAKGR